MTTTDETRCSWDDFGTPKTATLLNVLISQSGHSLSAIVSLDQWTQIATWIREGTPFQIEQQANQRTMGVFLVIDPRRGGLLVQAAAIPRGKDGEQVIVEKGQPAPARKFPRPDLRPMEWPRTRGPVDDIAAMLAQLQALVLGLDWPWITSTWGKIRVLLDDAPMGRAPKEEPPPTQAPKTPET